MISEASTITLSVATIAVPEVTATPIPEGTISSAPSLNSSVPTTLSLQTELAMPDPTQPNASEIETMAVAPRGHAPIAPTKQLPKSPAKTTGIKPIKAKPVNKAVLDTVEPEGPLNVEIGELWAIHNLKSNSLSGGRAELKEVRAKLGQRLSALKKVMARNGRGGLWSSYLHDAKIPKTTADRYVSKWELSQLPNVENLTTGEVRVPSTDDIATLVKKLKPQLVRTLTTPEAIGLFLTALANALRPSLTAS